MATTGQGKLGKKGISTQNHEQAFKHVTLHEVSGNKVNARTRHVLIRSHADGMTRCWSLNAKRHF